MARRITAEGRVSVTLIEGYENQLRYGDTNIRVELKFDQRLHETGNLYIEVQETTAEGRWVPSGICRQDACVWYGIGDYSRLYVYTKAALLAEWERRELDVIEIARQTSRGFLIKPTDIPRTTERVWASTWNGE